MSDKISSGIKKNKNENSKYLKIALCGFAGSGIFFLLIILFSFITLKFALSDSLFMPLGLLFGAVSGFFSGYSAVRPVMQKGLLYGSSAGFICLLICGIITFALNGGKAGYGLIIFSVVILLSSTGGGIAAVSRKPKRKR